MLPSNKCLLLQSLSVLCPTNVRVSKQWRSRAFNSATSSSLSRLMPSTTITTCIIITINGDSDVDGSCIQVDSLPKSSSSSNSQLEPLHHHKMSSTDKSAGEVVVRANLIQPLASWSTRKRRYQVLSKSQPRAMLIWLGLRVSGQMVLNRHSPNEQGELSQWYYAIAKLSSPAILQHC